MNNRFHKRMISLFLTLAFFVILGYAPYSIAEKINKKQTTPDWVKTGKSIIGYKIPEKDYPYLASWLDENSKPAQDYVIDLFKKHKIVILGEFHHVKEHKDFIIDLIPKLYNEAGVRCIGWEFSRYRDNERLNRIVTADEYDYEAALDFARDQLAADWNSKEHWDIIEAIWRLNKSLKPNQDKMRLIGLDMDVDMCQFFVVMKTMGEQSPEFQEVLTEVLKRDATMANQVEKEIIEKRLKGFVFVGRCHDFTHHKFPPNINMGRDIMGNLLYEKYGNHAFQVWLASGWLPPFEKVMKLRKHKPVGFDLYASPFKNILSPPGWDAPEVALSKIARGYVYLGPRSSLHKNTPIKGFVTDEMFKRYKHYYEIDFGRSFKDANEVDLYLQKHRFPKP